MIHGISILYSGHINPLMPDPIFLFDAQPAAGSAAN